MAPRLSELLGQPVIVENVVGAGGQIGASRVARGAADGYHLLFGTVSSQAFSQTLFKKPLYDAATDFAPIILLAEQPMMLVTSEALPVENLQDFIAAVFSKHRSAILSEVATADEQGLTDFEGKQWSAIFAPKGTPAPLIKRLHAAFNDALETPEVRARIESYGAEPVGYDRRSPEYLQEFVESEIRKWAVPIKTSGAGGQ
jgi:tripartite-type tricarboxylate transporter receptor subunit TctC